MASDLEVQKADWPPGRARLDLQLRLLRVAKRLRSIPDGNVPCQALVAITRAQCGLSGPIVFGAFLVPFLLLVVLHWSYLPVVSAGDYAQYLLHMSDDIWSSAQYRMLPGADRCTVQM